MLKFKEKMLRMYIDEFIKKTQEGAWLWNLKPDNVTIKFWDLKNYALGMSVGAKSSSTQDMRRWSYSPPLIHELWHLK